MAKMAKANLKGFDELFESSEQPNEKSNGIESLPISKLQPFSKHPFKKHNPEKMRELADSIEERGIIVPILVRPFDNGMYEIVAGHNRVEASTLAGLDIVPCDIREMDDDTATILMVDSNLQRETVLPSEKAWAYRYKLEAIKSQGKRNDLTSHQVGEKLDRKLSVQRVADNTDDSMNQILRYIRLTYLIPQLLDKVDEKKLAFIPAVELSYLKEQELKWLYSNLEREEYFGVPLALARKLKGISQNGQLTEKKIDELIVSKVKTPPKQVKISHKIIRKYFADDITPQERDSVIDRALEEWFKRHPEKSNVVPLNQDINTVR
jgi:ParB family chromosome partitioning protein